MPRKGSTEQDMLQVVNSVGESGILQSELWKRLNADSREGSRAVLRLEKKGLIERKRELHGGRWTFRVLSKRKLSRIDSIANVPCAFCEEESKCGQSAIVMPSKCTKLTMWLEGILPPPAEQSPAIQPTGA
jgi:DNA-binding MarR family transcriptional regulator